MILKNNLTECMCHGKDLSYRVKEVRNLVFTPAKWQGFGTMGEAVP